MKLIYQLRLNDLFQKGDVGRPVDINQAVLIVHIILKLKVFFAFDRACLAISRAM